MNKRVKKGAWVALVEDDVDVRETLCEVLEEEGYVVRSFSEGQLALTAFGEAQHLPALLLLDLKMPKMDGFAFRAAQKNQARAWQIPTVILSADSNVEENMQQLEAQGYLRKPIHIQTLLDLVERFVTSG